MRPHVFRETRLREGLTQPECAELLGKSKRTIGRYENGATPVPQSIAKLLEALVAERRRRKRGRPRKITPDTP